MAWVTKLTTIRTQLKKLLRLLTQNCFSETVIYRCDNLRYT